MNREIKFRGQRIDNKEWVFGYLVIDPSNGYRIYWKPFEEATSNTYHFVIPETVGQYTGVEDKNRIKIYEGDIIQVVANDGTRLSKFKIIWSESRCMFMKYREDHACFNLETSQTLLEVIGNIFETPNLLS